jgi:hypothetical protein
LKLEVPYKDKKAVKVLLGNYATENNFNITTYRSDKQNLYYKCQKGGFYRKTRNVNEDECKRLGKTTQAGCSYMIRLYFRSKNNAFFLAYPNNENESYHNHSLTESNLFSTAPGRRSALTQNEAILATARNIQRAVTGDDSLLHKLTINDINNLCYKSVDGVSDKRPFKTASRLIQLMEDSQYTVGYGYGETNHLDRIFFFYKRHHNE